MKRLIAMRTYLRTKSIPKTTKATLIVAFFVIFLAVQVTVSTAQLFASRPARFGWQMYSSLGQLPTFWIVTNDGTNTLVDLQDEVGYVRLEIDYIATIPQHLCATDSTAVSVRMQPVDSSEITDYPCR